MSDFSIDIKYLEFKGLIELIKKAMDKKQKETGAHSCGTTNIVFTNRPDGVKALVKGVCDGTQIELPLLFRRSHED